MNPARPILWLVGGPNGAGKSTYYRREIAPRFKAPFINADVIAARHWPQDAEAHSYEAAKLAEAERQTCLRERRSFVAETVFSHPSKLELLHQARAGGFEVWLSYINLVSANLSAMRVADRVTRGGHNVPLDKIAARYARVRELMAHAVLLADKAWVLDNSRLGEPYRLILLLEQGQVIQRATSIPAWAKNLLKPPPAPSSRSGKVV